MGCEFNFRVLKAKNDVDAKTEVVAIIEQAAYDYGHAGYTGSFAEADGVKLKSKVFETIDEAEGWLDENAEKWGPAVVVKTKAGEYCVGALCAS